MNDDRSDSSVTSIEDDEEERTDNTENLCENPTRDILAEGFFRLFKPVIDDLDSNIRGARTNQVELRHQLDELSGQMKNLNFENDPQLHEYFKRMVHVKQKVVVIMNILQGAQERLVSLCQQQEQAVPAPDG
ncbi:SNAPIN protein homolog [Toxorhynchites rutilus septentrionalis]|uniref:SNAPIN protein homolog n=1 Tax=Toxorhynchites rutilus septentrionalis TaxID=329112 RepID=UPI0024783A63|nr:SNAPIN protein homolog [Toxorhynchites rutilus septentrionalis]